MVCDKGVGDAARGEEEHDSLDVYATTEGHSATVGSAGRIEVRMRNVMACSAVLSVLCASSVWAWLIQCMIHKPHARTVRLTTTDVGTTTRATKKRGTTARETRTTREAMNKHKSAKIKHAAQILG